MFYVFNVLVDCEEAVCGVLFAAVPDMPRNVSVVNETDTTVSITASLPRRLDSANSLPVTSWRIQYERQSTDGDTLAAVFNTSMSFVLCLMSCN